MEFFVGDARDGTGTVGDELDDRELEAATYKIDCDTASSSLISWSTSDGVWRAFEDRIAYVCILGEQLIEGGEVKDCHYIVRIIALSITN